ncbi:MAG: MIP family channel protein [Rubrobacter sp.]|nr:MIP family channel protein [Rubrobacter sp.]
MTERYERGERRPAGASRRGAARSTEGRGVGGGTAGLYGSELTSSNMARAAAAEVIGTFLLVFTGTVVATAAILGAPTAGDAYSSLGIVLAFGLVLAAIVGAIGHVSGAHVNPAVTLGLAATGKFPWQYVPAYLVAQLVGAILGAFGTWIAFGSAARSEASVAATFPQEGVGDLRALSVEVLITFLLVFVIISVATDNRVPGAVAPLAVGFALSAAVFIGGPVTGGAVNPARALGPMLVALEFTAVWVYIVGPVIGGVLAALIYDRFIGKAEDPG